MPLSPRGETKIHLAKARESALLAVEIYNKPGTEFRSGGFIVLMIVAWTALFHAIYFKKKQKPFYWDALKHRYVKVDGDYKAWELSECVRQFYGVSTGPARQNLEFFIGLRNKIEHRSMPSLDIQIFGECQALLFNFEDLLFQEFGAKYAINESLALALQFSRLRDPKQSKAMLKLHKPLAKNIQKYITGFRSSLSSDDLSDLQFSYKVFVIPKLNSNPNQADQSIEFVKFDPSKPEEMEGYEKLVALIKPSVRQVANQGRLKPKDICDAVEPIVKQAVGPTARFCASTHHVKACFFYQIRPRRNQGNPSQTITHFCQYDECHKDYVYTEEWKKFLISEMKKPGQYERIMDSIRI